MFQARLFFAFLLFCLSSTIVVAEPKSRYVIGAEALNYYPHYDFSSSGDRGFAWAVLNEFAEHENIEIVYISLPIRRLQKELEKGTVDFAYPDNPKWHKPDNSVNKIYSRPITTVMGGTMVLPSKQGLGIAEFNTLTVPLGFTPVMWNEFVDVGKVKIVSVKDAFAALQMVQKARVDGADIEFHVAQHILKLTDKTNALVLDPSLPYDIVNFHLSTIKHASLLTKLNLFLEANPEKLAAIKARYGLRNPANILAEAEKKIGK